MRAVGTWIGLALLLGCRAGVDQDPRGAPVAQDQVRNIRVLGLETGLPPSATQVWLLERHWLDSIQMLRFDASLADARAFTSSVLGRETVAGENPHLHVFKGYPWWLHNYPKGAEGGSRNEPGHTVDLVLVPKGERATVWILVSRS
jgi:hypothetical protein